MKILVTGGAGFIGSHVVDAYIAAGHQVAVIDDLSTGNKKNLNPRAAFYKADICDLKALAEIFHNEQPEVVNHHAAKVSVTQAEKDPEGTGAVNITGTKNLLALCKEYGVRRFILASTGGAMFSDPAPFPGVETAEPNPISYYGQSKLQAEQVVKASGIPYIILRYSNVFGPRQNPHGESGVVAIFCDLAKTGGTPIIYGKDTTRDYVYVEDVSRANLIVLTTEHQDIYHIATRIQTTNQEVFEAVRDAFNWKTNPNYQQLRPGEVPRSALDASKAARELGWKPTISFTEGVRLIHAYKN